MANTFTSLHYHIVFSTKNREPWICQACEERVWSFLAGIAKQNGLVPMQIGGMENHIHVLVGAPSTAAPCKIAQQIKGGSSAWIHDTFPEWRGFGWQDGYGVFSVSRSNVGAVAAYIRQQRAHHQKKTFEEEYLTLLRKHGIDYDERYVWG
jgi:putative transposase